ncbi:MAG: hypothetical protein PWR26_102 [Methanosarcinales archaeon]|nr:MAG: hypothetical protein XD62_1405 [Methanosarcinales archeaon 56_1174]MDI3487385.1 hypothetical protein [Methanosarcinales archaeon]
MNAVRLPALIIYNYNLKNLRDVPIEYDRDLNACIIIARRVTSSTGWGSCEPPEPADEGGSVKLQLNAGSSPTCG